MSSSRVSPTLVSATILGTLLLGACQGNESRTAASASRTFGAAQPSLSQRDCAILNQEYVLAVQEARACDPLLDTKQCTLRVWDSLACSCPNYVNPRNKEARDHMNSVVQAWQGGGCSNYAYACLMSLCRQMKDSVCRTVASAGPSEPDAGICGD
jgi:hypothetical protein